MSVVLCGICLKIIRDGVPPSFRTDGECQCPTSESENDRHFRAYKEALHDMMKYSNAVTRVKWDDDDEEDDDLLALEDGEVE